MSGITRKVEGSKGRYILRDGEAEAELTYSVLSATRIIADHTACRTQCVAPERAVAWSRG